MHKLAKGGLAIDQVQSYIAGSNTIAFIDSVELCVRYIDRVLKPMPATQRDRRGISQKPEDAIDEINLRFRQALVGFQFEEGEVFRIDSQFVHEEVVKPALKILSAQGFEGPRLEFLEAHRCYRSGENEQAIVEAAKAFESTLKAICDQNGWSYKAGSRASDLLKVVRANDLWPDYLDGSFDQLTATLASGLPKVRNEAGAHGQGAEVRSTPSYIASYALHLCAAKITLMSEAQNALLSAKK